MGKKTSKTQQTTVTTPSNPEWVDKGQQAFSGATQNLLGQDPHSFVAGATDLMKQQFGLAGDLGTQGAGYLNQAAQMAGAAGETAPVSHATAQTAYGGIDNYLNPYTSYVAGNTLNDMFRGLQMAQNENGRGAVISGQGYGGSRQGLLDSVSQRDFFDRAGSTMGNLYSSGFNTALGASDSDANRAQQTSIFNAGADNTAALAAQQAKLQSAGLLNNVGQFGINNLGNAAGQQQGLAQAQASAPLDVLQQLGAINSGMPYGLFNGSTQTTNGKTTTSGGLGGVLGGLGTLAMGAGALGFAPFGGGSGLGAFKGLL